MKKVIILLMALAFAFTVSESSAKSKLEKALEKELSVKMKEYKKGKWEILGGRTMEVALAKHYDRLNSLGENGKEYVGISTATKSKNTGVQSATNNAVITYAQSSGSSLQGRVVSDMNADGVDTSAEFDKFYAAYERLVEKEIKNEMEPSYSIIRKNADGTYEVQSFFIVEESAARKARQRALEGALKESEAAQKYADKIAGFVNEAFD